MINFKVRMVDGAIVGGPTAAEGLVQPSNTIMLKRGDTSVTATTHWWDGTAFAARVLIAASTIRATVGVAQAVSMPSDAWAALDTSLPTRGPRSVTATATGTQTLSFSGKYAGLIVIEARTAAEWAVFYTTAIDTAVADKARTLITTGTAKAMIYDAKSAEVKAYRASLPAVLSALVGATMASSYPTLMAAVSVWNPTATTDAAKRTALAAIVTKVEAGIAASQDRLRKIDAIGWKAKEDLRTATTDAQRQTILTNTAAAISAV